MNNFIQTILVGILLITAVQVEAHDQPKTIKGTYYIRGKTPIDPPADEPQDTHMLMRLRGQAAYELFNSMKVAASPDECLGNGAMTKRIGGMQCSKRSNGRDYSCDFSINIAEQKIDGGLVC